MTDKDVKAGVDGDNVVEFPGGGEPPEDRSKYKERKDTCPLVPLGHNKGTYYFLSPSGEMLAVEGRTLTQAGQLAQLVTGNVTWYATHWPKFDNQGKPSGFGAAAAGAWLMRECGKAGMWDPDTPLRGAGVWRAGPLPSDGLLVHCGDVLLQVDATGVRRSRPGQVRDRAIFPALPAIARPGRTPAPTAVGRRILEALKLWNFADRAGPELLLGWYGASLLGGAPRWRAHLYLLATFGSGKTWLAELGEAVLGAMAHEAANNFTEAGLRQALTNEARAVILDEAEADEGNGRVERTLELIRHMSSGKGARIMRGTADGTAKTFAVTGSVCMSSVLPGRLKPQDRSRITLIQLLPLSSGAEAAGNSAKAEAAIVEAREASPALWARALAGWQRFCETFEAYRLALMDQESPPREADQFATLLAGRDLLIEDTVPDTARLAAALELVKGLVNESREDAKSGEGEQCWERLLTSGAGLMAGGRELTFAELIVRARGVNGVDARHTLEALGVKVKRGSDPRGIEDVVFVSNRHQGLARAYDGTRWGEGGHVQALRYLPGARATRDAVRFGGLTQRATEIPSVHLPDLEDVTVAAGDRDGAGP